MLPSRELAEYEKYEQLVAQWLDGTLAPGLTPGFDVYKCVDFPGITIQVKVAHIYHFKGSAKRHMTKMWTFNQYKLTEPNPHYFVLIGINDEDNISCFLLPRQSFIDHAAKNSTGGRILSVSSNRTVRRGGYLHEPLIWKYEVNDPENNLKPKIKFYESWNQLTLSFPKPGA